MNVIEKNQNDITNEIKNEFVKNECEDIGKKKKWKRNCPKCNKELLYKSKRGFFYGKKRNSVCQECVKEIWSKQRKGKVSNRKGCIMSEDQKKKISLSNIESHKKYIHPMLGKHHTEKTKEKFKNRINPMLGKHHSLETRLKISETRKKRNIPGPTISIDGIKRLRIKRIKEIEKDKFDGNQIIPSFNKRSCEFFDRLNKELKLNGKFATNGGEHQIKELGYFVDYYEPEENIVIEWDEKKHYNVNGSLKDDDIKRENEIKYYLKCKFYRIKENILNEEKVIRDINEYISIKKQ